MAVDSYARSVAAAALSQGGSGGTSNYDQLTNRPQINGVTLTGDKSAEDLGIDTKILNITGTTEEKIVVINKWLNNRDTTLMYENKTALSSYEIINNVLYLYFLFQSPQPVKYGTLIVPTSITASFRYMICTISNGVVTDITSDTGSVLNPVYTNNLVESILRYKNNVSLNDEPNALVPKKYVDEKIGDINTVLATLTTVTEQE